MNTQKYLYITYVQINNTSDDSTIFSHLRQILIVFTAQVEHVHHEGVRRVHAVAHQHWRLVFEHRAHERKSANLGAVYV
jgi:hypothetical protein